MRVEFLQLPAKDWLQITSSFRVTWVVRRERSQLLKQSVSVCVCLCVDKVSSLSNTRYLLLLHLSFSYFTKTHDIHLTHSKSVHLSSKYFSPKCCRKRFFCLGWWVHFVTEQIDVSWVVTVYVVVLVAWRSGSIFSSCPTSGPVSTRMGDRLQVGIRNQLTMSAQPCIPPR